MVSAEWAQVFTRWAELGFGLVQSTVVWILLFVAFNRVMHAVERKQGAGDVMPSGKVMLRRLWCRHRHVARVRHRRSGHHFTACIACAKDVNRGKPREAWR